MYLNLKHIVVVFCFLVFAISAQTYTEPSKQKKFNITVNHDDYTVKTQMLSHNKDIKINNERTYMWYSSQKIMETKGGFEGKLIHGQYTSFYLNNQLREQGTVNYGLKDKEWKYWYPDGQLREIITWKNGVKNGTYCLYNDYGQLMAKSTFKNDKLNGKFYTYAPNGIVTDKKRYKDGNEIFQKEKTEKPKKEKKPKEVKPIEQKKEKEPKQPKEKPVKKRKKTPSDSTDIKKEKIITS